MPLELSLERSQARIFGRPAGRVESSRVARSSPKSFASLQVSAVLSSRFGRLSVRSLARSHLILSRPVPCICLAYVNRRKQHTLVLLLLLGGSFVAINSPIATTLSICWPQFVVIRKNISLAYVECLLLQSNRDTHFPTNCQAYNWDTID